MQISQRGIDLIKKWEGLSLTPYRDASGLWTIGYGHCYGAVNKQPYCDGIAQMEADNLLKSDLAKAESNVNKYNYLYQFTQNEFDALVSFAYNIGSIDKLVKDGHRTRNEIIAKIPEYCKANGKVLRGLYNRRMDELSLFLEPMSVVATPSTEETVPFLYKVTINNLLIRKDADINADFVRDANRIAAHTGIGVFTIVEVKNGWGKLKSGKGWISLDARYGYRLK